MSEPDHLTDWLARIAVSDFEIRHKKSYATRARHYIAWLEGIGLQAPQVTIDTLRLYFAHLRRTISYRTTKIYVADVLRLHRFAREADPSIFPDLSAWSWPEETADEDGAGDLVETRANPVSVEDLKRHFQCVYDGAESVTHAVARLSYSRRLAMAEMVYGSGLSPREIISLRTLDVDNPSIDRGYFELRSSAGIRPLPITAQAVRAIRSWRDIAANAGIDTSTLVFPSLKGPGALLQKDVTREMRTFGNLTGIFGKDGLNYSTLRWAFANHLLGNGADLRLVAYCLNYQDLRQMVQFTDAPTDSADAMQPVP